MMYYLVSIEFDEEHRMCCLEEGDSKEQAEEALLEEFGMGREDVISIDASPTNSKPFEEQK